MLKNFLLGQSRKKVVIKSLFVSAANFFVKAANFSKAVTVTKSGQNIGKVKFREQLV